MALQEPVAQVEDHLGGPAQRDDLKGMFGTLCLRRAALESRCGGVGTGCEKFCV